MTKLVLRGLLTRKLRTVLTSLAIILGVAMVTGTFVLTDQINAAFKDIFQTGNAKVDAVLSRQVAFGSSENAGPLPDSLIDTARGVDGVAEADGQVQADDAQLVVDGDVVNSTGAPSLAFSDLPPSISPLEYAQGHEPQASGQLGVIKKTADDEHLRVGQRVGLTTDLGTQPFTISGIFNYGNVSSIGGATVVTTTFDDAQRLFDRRGETSVIYAKADPGVSASELVRRIREAVPSYVKVQTAQQDADESTKEIAGGINDFLRPTLLAFGGVALLVGAFIIFNTFSITVAQRVREFAMLRTVGSTRRQVLRAVIGESVVIGVLASIIGILAGLGIAKAIQALFNAVGFGLPATGLVVKPRTVIIALVVGVGITLLAALGPALRATRVPPIAALREGATIPRGRFSRLTPYLSGLILAAGIAFLVIGLVADVTATQALQLLGLGAVLVFIGAGMSARYVVRPLAAVIGWPIERIFGTPGRLAHENVVRNPARTAATAAALMIGVGLVAFVAIFAAGLKQSFGDAIDKVVQGDLILNTDSFQGFPAASTPVVAAVPGVADVEPLRFDSVKINRGGTDSLNALDPARATRVFDFDWQRGGTNALFARLGLDDALVEHNFASDHNLVPGGRFRVTTKDGRTATLRVIGEYKDPVLFTGFTVSNATANQLDVEQNPVVTVVGFGPGANPAATQAAVERAVDQRFPSINVRSNSEYKDEVERNVNQILYLIYALLAISLVISLFGIVNTLVLSIYERTREIGMLRAIGTTRHQLRRIIRYESVITSVIGALLGIVIGILFGWIVSKGLESQGIEFAVPWGTLVVFLVLAVLAGVLAATLPARRAARLNVLEALHYE
jgi:putative ABC transport system permease protein